MRRALTALAALVLGYATLPAAPSPGPSTLGYHAVRLDAQGRLLPWSSDEPGAAYDHVVRLVWQFWHGMRRCPNGLPYYLQHQVWTPDADDWRGLGGDQISMALSSWALLYGYLGDPAIVSDMRLMADTWLAHGLSSEAAAWPRMPFPYNTNVHSGVYDGDMRAGPGVLQPDKAASFGAELVTLYRITGNRTYLDAARHIADVLAAHVSPGTADVSPWPYRVVAESGAIARGRPDWSWYDRASPIPEQLWAGYTANWTGALRLFDGLAALHQDTPAIRRARTLTWTWLQAYPLHTNNWGPFFEDIVEYSNTAINADTMAAWLVDHPAGGGGLRQARATLDWVERTFSNREFEALQVVPINEQTRYQVPGNSHTARHASVELAWAHASGDWSRKDAQVRRLNWATYMVDDDGKNRYPRDDIWLTDGYGDYVRHYLRAMAASPDLAPAGQAHLLSTTSTIQSIDYTPSTITYRKFDAASTEVLRLGGWRSVTVSGGTFTWDAAAGVLVLRATQRVIRVIRVAG
jgi:hypothetical protein